MSPEEILYLMLQKAVQEAKESLTQEKIAAIAGRVLRQEGFRARVSSPDL